MIKYLYCLPFLFTSFCGIAQSVPQIPNCFTSQQKAPFISVRDSLVKRKDSINNKIDEFDKNCEKATGDLIKLCETAFDQIQKAAIKFGDDIGRYKESLKHQLMKNIGEVKTKISKDSIAIRSLNFNKSAEDFEKWSKLSAKEMSDLKKMDRELLVDGLTASLGKNVDELSSIDLKKAKDVKKKMEELGITNPFAKENKLLQKGIILLGQAKNKKEKGEAIRFYIDGFGEMLKKGLNESKDDPSGFEKFKEVVGIFLLLPEIPPVVRLAVTGTFNAYILIDALGGLYYGNQDVDNMTRQTEENLKNLKSFTALMKSDVSELIKAKEALTELQK